MVQVDETTQGVLNQISEGFEQKGAYNLRQNGIPLCHGDSEHIKIRKKEDKPGIDILIDGETKGEKVFIPVVVSVSGMTDLVYNDFYVADGADVTIVAGPLSYSIFSISSFSGITRSAPLRVVIREAAALAKRSISFKFFSSSPSSPCSST